MSIRHQRREAAIERVADQILKDGLARGSLRTLAAAAGTSDRMLLYYFADKDELLGAALGRIAERLTGLLDAAVPATVRQPYEALLPAVWRAVASPSLAPFMHVWLELAAGAARLRQPDRTLAGAIVDGFIAWIDARLAIDDADARARAAALLLATIDGLMLLDAVGRGTLADAATETTA